MVDGTLSWCARISVTFPFHHRENEAEQSYLSVVIELLKVLSQNSSLSH